MKKTALFLTLVLILSTLLSSCASTVSSFDDLDKLWKKVDKAMNSLKSYEMDIELEMKLGEDYGNVDSKGTNHTVVYQKRGKITYFYEFTRTEVTAGDNDAVMEQLIAFDGEKLYESNVYDDRAAKFSSDITSAAFTEHFEGETDWNFSPDDAYEKSLEKSDGSYIIKLSEFKISVVNDFAENTGFDALAFGLRISDMSVEILVDKKHRVKEMDISIYAERKTEPVMTIKVAYSNYNDADKEEIDKNEYTEVDDVRILDWLSKSLSDKTDEKDGAFTIEQREQNVYAADRAHYNDGDKSYYDVKFNNGDRYTFDISYDVNGKSSTLQYNEGVMYLNSDPTSPNSKPEVEKATDKDAKDTVKAFLDMFDIKTYNVKSIQKESDGVYRIDCYFDITVSDKSPILSLGDRYSDYSFYYLVHVDGDEVTCIETYLEIIGKNYVHITHSTLDLDPDGEDGDE